jgi:tetratricopeptide (TPR) repeat protein
MDGGAKIGGRGCRGGGCGGRVMHRAGRKWRFEWRELRGAPDEFVGGRGASGQHAQAVGSAQQGIRQHPRSDWLWRELGSELTTIDRLDEAEKALNTARSLNPDADWVWRYFAGLHRKRKSLDNEIEALETLNELGVATAYDLNQLGIAHHNHKNFPKALEYYRLSAAAKSDSAPWFNMGLVFNESELSQDVDATDAYRRALALTPNHERAKEQLEVTKRKLVPLADQARTAGDGRL